MKDTPTGSPPPTRSPASWLAVSALGALGALAAALAFRTETSLDLGFHLRSGAFILEHGWPDKDTFTYTLNHRDYLDSQWGFQVLAVGLERLGGMVALTLAKVALVLVTLGLVARRVAAQPVSWPVALVVGMLALFTAELRFYVRPELVSYALLAGLLLLLARGRPWWPLPLIMLTWVNSHGLFALGLALVAARVAVEGLHALRGGRFDRSLGAWALASGAVCLVNPYGLRGALFPLELWARLSPDRLLNRSIAEFESPFSVLRAGGEFPPTFPLACFLALGALAAAGLLLRRREVTAFEVVLVGVSGFLAAKAIRNLPLFAICAAPSAAWGLEAGLARLRPWRPWLRRTAPVVVALSAALATLHVVNDGYYIAMRRPERFGSAVSELVYPVRAAAAIAAYPPGNLYNHLNFGGYLMWRLPDRKVFIDGRTEVVADAFFDDYVRLKTDPAAWRAATEQWDFRLAILPPDIDQKMAARLFQDPQWRLLFLDGVAAVFARDGQPTALEPAPDPQPLRTRALSMALPPPAPAEGWLTRRTFPFESFRLGVAWLVLGELQRAEYWLLRAALEGPRYREIWHDLGLVYGRRRELDRARVCFQRVLELDPGNVAATERLQRIAASVAGPAGRPP